MDWTAGQLASPDLVRHTALAASNEAKHEPHASSCALVDPFPAAVAAGASSVQQVLRPPPAIAGLPPRPNRHRGGIKCGRLGSTALSELLRRAVHDLGAATASTSISRSGEDGYGGHHLDRTCQGAAHRSRSKQGADPERL